MSIGVLQMNNATAASRRNESFPTFYYWTPVQEGWILSAYFFGYILTQFPGGILAQRFGGKWVFGVGVAMTALLTVLIPLAAMRNVWLLVSVRVLQGAFEGVSFPAMHVIWSHWAPPKERSILTAIAYSGSLGLAWFVLWAFVMYNSPSVHPWISAEEKHYIESCIGAVDKESMEPTPWLKIITSPHVWAIAVAHFCYNWAEYTLLTCMPTYLADIDILQGTNAVVFNGVFSAVPYLVLMVVALLSGPLADFLRTFFSTTAVRKMFTTIAFTASGGFLLLCSYFGTSIIRAVSLLSLTVGVGGFAVAGFYTNHLDIAPRYAGVLMALTNTAGTLPGIVGPLVAKAIALPPSAPKGSAEYIATYRSEWSEVFLLCVEIYMFGALIYLILGSGKKQPWADRMAIRKRFIN
eukprot:Em0438g9a